MNLSKISNRAWRGLTVGAYVVGASLGGLVAYSVNADLLGLLAAGLLTGFICAGMIILIALVAGKINALVSQTLTTREELRSMISIQHLLGTIPVNLGEWAIDAQFGKLIAQTIFEVKPSLVVECGSGSSTVLCSSCLHILENESRVVSLDHDQYYAEKTRSMLRYHEGGAIANVLHTPLTEYSLEESSYAWYDIPDDLFEKNSIDILIVDGPPEYLNTHARYPAVPILHPYLSPTCTILVDDGNRSTERANARKWAQLLGLEAQYVSNENGAWILSSK